MLTFAKSSETVTSDRGKNLPIENLQAKAFLSDARQPEVSFYIPEQWFCQNIQLTLSLLECLMEFCKVTLTFESVEIL